VKSVNWQNKADSFGGKSVRLSVLSVLPEGPTRIVRTLNVGQTFDVATSKSLLYTVTVRCEDVTGDALELAERIASGLEAPSVQDTLEAAGVVFVSFPMGAQNVDSAIDDRATSAAIFDVQFRSEFYLADPVSQSTIEQAQGDGELTNAAETITVEINEP
jgi:membrane protease subunit (stomatin/prohibitin family)